MARFPTREGSGGFRPRRSQTRENVMFPLSRELPGAPAWQAFDNPLDTAPRAPQSLWDARQAVVQGPTPPPLASTTAPGVAIGPDPERMAVLEQLIQALTGRGF